MIALEENDILIPISLSRPRKTIFSHKIEPQNHSVLILNESQVQVTSENHFGMFLDSKMRFDEHLTILPVKFNKSIGPLTKLKTFLPTKLLVTIYKLFIKAIFSCGDVIYN